MTLAPTDARDLKVHFINVGYGDSILVELPEGKTLLIDAGSRGEAVKIAGYLRRRKIRKIDSAVITHPHENHFGGFFRLMEEFPVAQLFINGDRPEEDGYPDLLKMFSERHVPVSTLKRGDQVPGLPKGVTAETLHPALKRSSDDRNASSLVLRLIYGNVSFLFTGDINEDVQKELRDSCGTKLCADCIQIPHHGLPISRTFTEYFKAPLYIISTGPSRWGLPSSDELSGLPGKVLRTDKEGTVELYTEGARLRSASLLDPQ